MQMSSFACYILEAGVQIMKCPKPDKVPKGYMHLSDVHSNRGLVAVMDLQGVTAHSFKQFTLNLQMCLKLGSYLKEFLNLKHLCL